MHNLEANPIARLLRRIGISDLSDVEQLSPCTRDRRDIGVLRCRQSGVIFLDGVERLSQDHYVEQDGFAYWEAGSREASIEATRPDDRRRADAFGSLIRGRRWLDVGTGPGGILDMLAPEAAEAVAVEPQRQVRHHLNELGYPTWASLADVRRSDLEVITLFHVLEHMFNPIEELQQARRCLADDGLLIIEVPHARDALITHYDLETFRQFTFWSEHLILHTRESLRACVEAAGLRVERIDGMQRYPLANHLYWLRHGKPGGHERWRNLTTPDLDAAYSDMLRQQDLTDSLVLHATKSA